MKFAQETLEQCLEEAKPLLFSHYKEIAHYLDIPFNPDYEQYKRAESMGMLRIYTARDDVDGKLIGYGVFFVKGNIHYKDSLQAVQDIIYIDKEKRGLGMMFIKFCDDKLREDGVQVIYHHVKAQHNFGRGLERMGYELIDLIYGKRLDK